ncbi:MAG TPA: ankyrin repeat domain-containing protein [Chthoniobacteraceae bacterium]|jgi:ankyrin repeat protein|nr:ankyrin repeat domain-containing protein [Chthoniobacteraceae bacterium]
MHSATPKRHRRFVIAAALVVAALAGPVSIAGANEFPIEGALKSAVPGLPTTGQPEAPQSWIQKIFARPSVDARRQAVAQIEALGLTLDADSCNRAVVAKNRRLIELFLGSGFDLNAKGALGRTPLLTAALQQDWPLVTELLKAGANPNLPDDAGATVLMAAVTAPQSFHIEELVKSGADVKAKDRQGHTALHYAVSTLQPANIAALLRCQAPVTGSCCEGSDLLDHAFATARQDIIVPILEAEPGNLTWNTEARAFLAKAVANRHQTLTKLTLSKFAGPPTPEGKAQPLLAYALLDGDLDTFKFLLDCGADANTLLGSPVEKEFSARVPSAYCKLYLDNEAGMTVLMLAAGMEKTDCVRLLLEHGAKRGIYTAKYKMAALYFAAHSEVAEIMQLLIGDSSPTPEQMRIEISLSSQRLNLYKDGASIFTAPVSTGRPGFSTPAGKFVITDKHLVHTSTIYKTAQMPFFMRLNCRDFGMHEGQLPGYPASHGCIRLPGSAARQLFKDVPIGTLVTINH